MFQMFEPVIGEGYFSLGNVKGVQDLIVDPRMKKYAEGGEIWRHYAFADRAEGVNDNLCWWIDELKEVLEQRLVDGKFGAQHGDPRPVNVALVEKDDGGVAAVLMDAVRLALRTEDAPDGRVMKEWFMTDVLLQGGTALGKMLALGQNAWFKTGVEEFAEQFGEDIFDDRHLGLLFGVGLAYGISVEIHVLGYQWEEAFKGGDVAEVYRLNDELEIFWHAIEDLANNPNSWKKYYE